MLSSYTIYKDNQPIIVSIVYSDRRTLGLEIKNCQAICRVPKRINQREICSFIDRNANWIFEKYNLALEREKIKQENGQNCLFPAYSSLTTGQRMEIRRKITQRTFHYARIMQIDFNHITIRDQKTRWGSCSSRGNLNFNYKLYYMDEDLLDYVVIHELSHRKHMDHSPAFWSYVAIYCPDYKERRARLKCINT